MSRAIWQLRGALARPARHAAERSGVTSTHRSARARLRGRKIPEDRPIEVRRDLFSMCLTFFFFFFFFCFLFFKIPLLLFSVMAYLYGRARARWLCVLLGARFPVYQGIIEERKPHRRGGEGRGCDGGGGGGEKWCKPGWHHITITSPPCTDKQRGWRLNIMVL